MFLTDLSGVRQEQLLSHESHTGERSRDGNGRFLCSHLYEGILSLDVTQTGP